MKTHIAIIGAGPGGLALSNALLRKGVTDFLLLERETEVGGLCRSREVDGWPLDIGGGHFLDVRRPVATEFLFGFMPESEWDKYERDSRILIHGQEIGSPFEANVWQLPPVWQERYLADIAAAGCVCGAPRPSRFVDWIYWKLGKGIAEDYMLPYNRKLFGDDLNQLGTYWLDKLPDVSYDDTLRSCRERRPFARQPGHAVFYYPRKYGYGEVWRRMGDALGNRLVLGCPVTQLDVQSRIINGDMEADIIVNTAPWTSFGEVKGLSVAAADCVAALRHTSIDVDYVGEMLNTKAQWVYLPDPSIREHRWLVRHNFCSGKGYWKETRSQRNSPERPGALRFTMDYAYPLNTIGKNEKMKSLLDELSNSRVFGLGRWGEWQHYNSDVVVERAIRFADALRT